MQNLDYKIVTKTDSPVLSESGTSILISPFLRGLRFLSGCSTVPNNFSFFIFSIIPFNDFFKSVGLTELLFPQKGLNSAKTHHTNYGTVFFLLISRNAVCISAQQPSGVRIESTHVNRAFTYSIDTCSHYCDILKEVLFDRMTVFAILSPRTLSRSRQLR